MYVLKGVAKLMVKLNTRHSLELRLAVRIFLLHEGHGWKIWLILDRERFAMAAHVEGRRWTVLLNPTLCLKGSLGCCRLMMDKGLLTPIDKLLRALAGPMSSTIEAC